MARLTVALVALCAVAASAYPLSKNATTATVTWQTKNWTAILATANATKASLSAAAAAAAPKPKNWTAILAPYTKAWNKTQLNVTYTKPTWAVNVTAKNGTSLAKKVNSTLTYAASVKANDAAVAAAAWNRTVAKLDPARVNATKVAVKATLNRTLATAAAENKTALAATWLGASKLNKTAF